MTQRKLSKGFVQGLLLGTLGFGLIACSIKAEEPKASPVQRFADPSPTIQGPEAGGTWESNCVDARFGTGSRRVRVVFSGDSFQRTQTNYSDISCQALTGTTVDKGIFRYIDAYADGGYGVEYHVDNGDGWHSYPQEKLWIDPTGLYLSDFWVGASVSKVSAIRFAKIAIFSELGFVDVNEMTAESLVE